MLLLWCVSALLFYVSSMPIELEGSNGNTRSLVNKDHEPEIELVHICQWGVDFYVSRLVLPLHIAWGAVELIDEDGDGYFTQANSCGLPVDCDDTNPDIQLAADNADCDPSTPDAIAVPPIDCTYDFISTTSLFFFLSYGPPMLGPEIGSTYTVDASNPSAVLHQLIIVTGGQSGNSVTFDIVVRGVNDFTISTNGIIGRSLNAGGSVNASVLDFPETQFYCTASLPIGLIQDFVCRHPNMIERIGAELDCN